ncbi:MAG: SAP domain-containing protein [Legionella sp.]|nr:SAP domain-containing protein [Legionella sp.]
MKRVELLKNYISKNGFGPQTPLLSRALSADTFRQHYYDKQTLIKFCRSIGIPTSGLKNDINDRIDTFLRTGHVVAVTSKKKSKAVIPDSEAGLLLDKQVVYYKSDLITRNFFQKHIPEFTGFSALVQKQIKARLNQGEIFTYCDEIEMQQLFLKNKNKSKIKQVAHDACQYNQFLIDYSQDKTPKIHSAKEAWLLVRDSAGEKTYQRYHAKIDEIKKNCFE